MGRRGAVAALAIVALLLAGCTPQRGVPEQLSDDEIMAILHMQQLEWWQAMHPGQTPPEVEVVAYVHPFAPSVEMDQCLRDANIPGVIFGDMGWTFENETIETQQLFSDAQYICGLKYPFDPAYAEQMGLLSAEQLDYLYAYVTERLVPCLQLLGYSMREVPTHEVFVASAPYLQWSPYDAMLPMSTTVAEWGRVDARCPQPPIGFFWRAGIDYEVVG